MKLFLRPEGVEDLLMWSDSRVDTICEWLLSNSYMHWLT